MPLRGGSLWLPLATLAAVSGLALVMPRVSATPARGASESGDPAGATLAIVWGGDIHLGRGVAEGMRRPGHADPLAAIRPYLAGADLRIANLEGPLTSAPRVTGGYYLTGDPAHVGLLATAGFDLLGVANNHATDNGRAGLAESMALLHGAGIATVGGGTRPEAYGPALLSRGGLRLAVFAYNFIPASLAATDTETGVAVYDEARALAALRAVREHVDLVFVMPHWGVEYAPRANAAQRQVARRLVEAGADAVIGHHPHEVQDVQWLPRQGRRPALVAYSLGNFVFDSLDPDPRRGALLWTLADAQGLRAFRALPLKTDWLGPRPLTSPADQAALTDRLLPDPVTRYPQTLADGQTWFTPPPKIAPEIGQLSVPSRPAPSYHSGGEPSGGSVLRCPFAR